MNTLTGPPLAPVLARLFAEADQTDMSPDFLSVVRAPGGAYLSVLFAGDVNCR